ncbi:MAG: hypothetical protein N2050_02295 [Flavobacteriales bacterium]|nr:hypothetical protein [Flavobacteriales bacterium]MCX7649369.1 hypothetical protein [Flavobacteriales bacterium]MDW8432758.1 hypothetical protein [Flavobacteriales bacterium]
MESGPENILLSLERIWYIVGTTFESLVRPGVEDPTLRLLIVRHEAPVIMEGVLKFKKNGFYREHSFQLSTQNPENLNFSIKEKSWLFGGRHSVVLWPDASKEWMIWKETLPRRRWVWHLLSASPHPERDALHAFLLSTAKHHPEVANGFLKFQPCIQRSEKADLSISPGALN